MDNQPITILQQTKLCKKKKKKIFGYNIVILKYGKHLLAKTCISWSILLKGHIYVP